MMRWLRFNALRLWVCNVEWNDLTMEEKLSAHYIATSWDGSDQTLIDAMLWLPDPKSLLRISIALDHLMHHGLTWIIERELQVQ